MRNKKLLKALAAFTMSVAAAGSMAMFGCAHTHTYSEEWDGRDASGHWHNATCEHTDERTETVPHVYTDDTDPDCNECGYVREIKDPTPEKHEHSWSGWKQSEDGTKHYKECEEDGCTTPVARKDEGDHKWVDGEDGKQVCQICGVAKPEATDTTLEDAKVSAKATLDSYKNANDYTTNATALADAIAAGKTAIDAATDTAGVDSALAAAKAAIDNIKSDATIAEEAAALTAKKTAAKGELDAIDATKYTINKTAFENAVADGKAAIDAATDAAGVDSALAAAKTAISAIKTDEELSEDPAAALAAKKADAKAALDEYDASKYTINKDAFDKAAADGKSAIEAATDIAGVDSALAEAKAVIDAIKTDEQEGGENPNPPTPARDETHEQYVTQFGDKVVYKNDFNTPVDKLPDFSGTYGTKGVYFLFNDKSDANTTPDQYYVTVADGYAKMVDAGANGTQTVFDFGTSALKTLEGYTEIKTNSTGNSWTFMQFIGNSEGKTGSEVLGLRTDGGNVKYRLDGGAVATPSATIASADTTYKIYFKFDFTTGKVEMTVNGEKFFGEEGLTSTITSIYAIKFVSSDNNTRTVDVDNFVVAGETKTLTEYKTEVLANLETEYAKYTLADYPENGKALTDLRDAAITAINAAESNEAIDELFTKVVADMKAVLTTAGVELANAKTAAINELNGTDKTNYTINVEAVDGAIADGVKAINAAATAEKVTEALNAAKAAIAAIDNDMAAITKAKADAITALEAHDGGAANFTEEGEDGNKTAYKEALSAGTTAINGVTVSETLTPVQAKAAIETALENAKAAITALNNNAEILANDKTAAIKAIDDLVKEKIDEIDAKVESGDITDTDKVAEVKTEIDSIRNARVRAIESAETRAQVVTEKTQAINNIETEAATLTASDEQLRTLAEKAIRDHAKTYIDNPAYAEYKTAIEGIRDDAITLLASKTGDEISELQTTTTREISVYVDVHEAYKEIDSYAANLKASIYNDAAKAEIDEEIKRGSEHDAGAWSAHMLALRNTKEVANVDVNKKVVLDALDKIVADLKATKFTVTINVTGIENVEVLYGGTVVIDDSTLADDKMIDDGKWYTNSACTEEFDFETKIYDNSVSLYAKLADAIKIERAEKFSYSAIKGFTDADDNAYITSFTGVNAFLTVVGEKNVTWRKSNSCIQNINGGLQFTVNSSATISITFSSTGGSNVSNIGIKDSEGKFVTASSVSEGVSLVEEGVSAGAYEMTGTSKKTLTFKLPGAGTYTIYSLHPYEDETKGPQTRGARIYNIDLDETYKLKKDVFVTWGDGEQETYHHSQEITVPAYTGTDALDYWYVEGNEEGTHYKAGEKITLLAGTYKMVAKTVTSNVIITYKVEGEDDKLVPYYVAESETGVTNTVADPKKEGFIFKGWYTKEESGEYSADEFDFSAVAAGDTIIVYAVFESKPAPSVWLFTNGESTTTNGASISNFDGAIEVAVSGSKLNNKDVSSKGVIINETTISKAIVTSGSGKTVTIKANRDMHVTVYACMTSSGGVDIAAGTLTVANATTGNGDTTVTSSDKYVALTFTLTAGTTCNITQSASKYIAIYEIDVEFM